MIDNLTEGFMPVAVRDDHNGNTVVSFNTETREFLLSVSGKLAGPFKIEELKVLRENINDVVEMRGRYMFIKDYDVRGDKK
jgi:uncharacterized protein (UPF0264 family)